MSERPDRHKPATVLNSVNPQTGTGAETSRVGYGTRLCDRCHGYVIEDIIEAFDEKNTSEFIWAWHCMNCGTLIDSPIPPDRIPGP